MNELESFIGGFERAMDDLSDAGGFFEANRSRYLKLAQDVAGQVLELLRPPEVEVDVWERRIVAMKRNILYLLLQNRNGFDLSYNGASKDEDEVNNLQKGGENEISKDDVMEWVLSGLAGDPEGKDVTKYEGSARPPEEIADTVYRAVSTQGLGLGEKDYGPIRAVIEEYYAREVGTGLGAFMESVLDSWRNAFVAILERDFGEWVDEQLRKI